MRMQDYSENYVIVTTNKKVEAWSSDSIPFEPKGWKKEMKLALRDSLKRLSSDTHNTLYSSYITDSRKFCDVENILLYNIGAGAFSNNYWQALCIERGYDTVPSPTKTKKHCLIIINMSYLVVPSF